MGRAMLVTLLNVRLSPGKSMLMVSRAWKFKGWAVQTAAAAAMLQQAQGNQGNGQPPLSIVALQQRLLAAARQAQPGAQAQLQSLLRHQDMSAAQAMAAGMVGQMSQNIFNSQVRVKKIRTPGRLTTFLKGVPVLALTVHGPRLGCAIGQH